MLTNSKTRRGTHALQHIDVSYRVVARGMMRTVLAVAIFTAFEAYATSAAEERWSAYSSLSGVPAIAIEPRKAWYEYEDDDAIHFAKGCPALPAFYCYFDGPPFDFAVPRDPRLINGAWVVRGTTFHLLKKYEDALIFGRRGDYYWIEMDDARSEARIAGAKYLYSPLHGLVAVMVQSRDKDVSKPSQTDTWILHSEKGIGASDWLPPGVGTLIPGAPANVRAVSKMSTTGTVTVTWDPPTGGGTPTGYKVFRRRQGQNWISTMVSASTFTRVYDDISDGSWEFKIQACDEYQCSIDSEIVTAAE